MKPLVEARDVTRRFGDLEAVSGLGLDLRPGEIFGLLGPNGAGKTTSVRMIGATLRPTRGTILVDGRDTVRDADGVKRLIGYMAQRFSLYGDLTARENLRFFAALYGLHGAAARASIDRAVGLTEMGDLLPRLAETMSGGQRQLLALAVAIVHDPRLLILDEPTAGLDPIHRQQIWDLLYHLGAAGHTILVTTHGMDEAERCQRLGFINRGRLMAVGTPRELKDRLRGRIRAALVDDLPRRAAALRSRAEVAWAHPHQGELRICLRDAAATAPDLATAAGVPPGDLRDAPPSLEDVFYDLAATPAAGAVA